MSGILKPLSFLFFFLLILLASQSHAQPQNPREQLMQYNAELQKNPNDYVLREKIIKIALELKPAPAVPKEAERYMVRGIAAMKDAKSADDFKDAVKEFEKASLSAPWHANAYYNLGIAQDKAGMYAEAIKSLNLYLIAAPEAPDAKIVEKLIYEVEYRQEKAQKETVAKKKEGTRSSDGRYIDNGDGTITDTKTGLMWTKKDSYEVYLGTWVGLDWNGSNRYASNLRTGGYSDWRLPTVEELKAIYEESKNNKDYSGDTIHIDPIFASGGSLCWSSDTPDSNSASSVSFRNGNVTKYDRFGYTMGARAVRR